MINSKTPNGWKDLQNQVGQILKECGYTVEIEKVIQTARNAVEIDVYAEDSNQIPPNKYLCECKNWKTAVPQTVIHGFRSVVNDSGANWGIIISAKGYQVGAIKAAKYTNIKLLNWNEFELLFEDIWIKKYMSSQLKEVAEPLLEYTEPINTRIFRKADKLGPKKVKKFINLRNKYGTIAFYALNIYQTWPGKSYNKPSLPLKKSMVKLLKSDNFSEDILEATSYRDLLNSMIIFMNKGLSEFDEVFGERA